MAAADYFKLAQNLLPNEFDGSPEKLQTFIDALTLLATNTEAQMVPNAISFVKTRLTGKARDVITNEVTLQAIIQTLRDSIKHGWLAS